MSSIYGGISPYATSPSLYGYPQTQQYPTASYGNPYGSLGGGYGNSGYGSGQGSNLLSYLLGALAGIPSYGNTNGYGNTSGYTQYGPLSQYSPFAQPATANINVQANSPFGYAQSLGNAYSGYYANTTGNAFTNVIGAGAQNASLAYGPMGSYGSPSYGGYGGYGGGYGGNTGYNIPTQTYSQSIANGFSQYTPPTSYPPVSLPPIYNPTPQPINNYGSSLTSAVAGPGAYANGTAGI